LNRLVVRTVNLIVMPTGACHRALDPVVGMTDRARFARQLPQQLLGVA
jgi:hypothetical protein